MARLNYHSGELHSNGEVFHVSSNKDCQSMYGAFDIGGQYVSEDGTQQVLLSKNSNSYLVLMIDPTEQKLAEKPSCNNWNDCCTPPTEGGE